MKEINVENFQKYSFPFLLRSELNNPEILNYLNKKFIMFNDNDLKTDFDFVLTYLAISNILKLFKIYNQNINISQHMNNIKYFISMISPEKRSTVYNELFSILFLQKDGKFVCAAQLAQTLLRTIEEYIQSPYVKQGLISLLPSISGQRGLEIENYFLAGKQALYRAISSRNWNCLLYTSPSPRD